MHVDSLGILADVVDKDNPNMGAYKISFIYALVTSLLSLSKTLKIILDGEDRRHLGL